MLNLLGGSGQVTPPLCTSVPSSINGPRLFFHLGLLQGAVNALMFLKLRAGPGHRKLCRRVSIQGSLEPEHVPRVMLEVVGEGGGGLAPVKLCSL